MDVKNFLDYRPDLTPERKINAPFLDAEVYESPEKALSRPLATFLNNRPSAVLQAIDYTLEIMGEKMNSLRQGDYIVQQFASAPDSLARQILYAQLEDPAGDTNVVVYDRLQRVAKDLQQKMELTQTCFFGKGKTLEEIADIEQKLIDFLSAKEAEGDYRQANYELAFIDMKLLILLQKYFEDAMSEVNVLLTSNEPVEFNVAPVSPGLIPLYDLRHDKALRDLTEGKRAMEILMDNDQIGNRFRRAYALRTRLCTMDSKLTSEEKIAHAETLREARADILEQLDLATIDLFKVVQSNKLSTLQFNKGFARKCEILLSLKGGIQL